MVFMSIKKVVVFGPAGELVMGGLHCGLVATGAEKKVVAHEDDPMLEIAGNSI